MTNDNRTPRLSLRNGLLAGAAALAIVGAGLGHEAWQPAGAIAQDAGAADGPHGRRRAFLRRRRRPGEARRRRREGEGRDRLHARRRRGRRGRPQLRGPASRHPALLPRVRPGPGWPRARGRPGPRGRQFGQSQGSGFFISADGYIVTNNHVVQNGVEVQVTMDDGRTLDATVVGADPKTDLAVLKVKQEGTYPFVRFAQGNPRIGDWVVAVGNPFGLGGTVTAGIVSARGRDIGSGPYDDYLQIDAAVNRGNSGGPTFDLNGDVVGVNTAIYSPSGGNVGIAFAVPSEVAVSVVEQLKSGGSVSRGFIGVQIQPVTKDIADSLGLKEARGALVAEAQADGPAAAAGVKAGDTIVSVDGKAVDGPRQLSREIAAKKPGSTVAIGVVRDGKEQTLSLKLGTLPGERQARAEIGRGSGVEGEGRASASSSPRPPACAARVSAAWS